MSDFTFPQEVLLGGGAKMGTKDAARIAGVLGYVGETVPFSNKTSKSDMLKRSAVEFTLPKGIAPISKSPSVIKAIAESRGGKRARKNALTAAFGIDVENVSELSNNTISLFLSEEEIKKRFESLLDVAKTSYVNQDRFKNIYLDKEDLRVKAKESAEEYSFKANPYSKSTSATKRRPNLFSRTKNKEALERLKNVLSFFEISEQNIEYLEEKLSRSPELKRVNMRFMGATIAWILEIVKDAKRLETHEAWSEIANSTSELSETSKDLVKKAISLSDNDRKVVCKDFLTIFSYQSMLNIIFMRPDIEELTEDDDDSLEGDSEIEDV